ELQAHLDGLTERHIAAGLSPEEARNAARREFGGVAQIQERAREARSVIWLENLARDIGFSVRMLCKHPGFTIVVVLTLALGLGVNTALFTWFNAAAFRPLPVSDPGRLFALTRLNENGSETKAMSYIDFVTYRDHQTVLAGLAAASGGGVELLDAAELNAVTGEIRSELPIELVSSNYFAVFGVPMALGRPLMTADETFSSALPVIVLSHRFWQAHFGGDPNVIGRTLRVRGLTEEALTVVGVTSEEFHGTRPGALAGWVPLLLRPGDKWRTDLKATTLTLTARLRPGVSSEHAAEELQVIANEFLARPRPGPNARETIVLTRASTYLNLTGQMLTVLLPMICLFGAVFLVSCANASNLILARTVTRQFEFAVRSALGATRRRLVTLLMTESLVLGVLGGLVGWAVAAGLLHVVLPWLLDMMPGAREGTAGLYLHADYSVFVFTLTVSMLAGAAGGSLPALHVTRRNVVSALNREGSPFGRRLRLSRVRSYLAVAQLALSSALLFTAGLLVHRALRTEFQDVGFDKSRLLVFEVLAPRTYESGQRDAARRQAASRLRNLPDVAAVSETPRFPFAPSRGTASVPNADATQARTVAILHLAVPSDYLATLQLPLTRGRFFAGDETPGDRVAVISETAARELSPDRDALGQ
ncbi:MAG TPA: ABC transporter permease, partial [Candidatus Synoicihabitans sp.]|nr:ABC transporter permease [Candidatus Synoicihabitans sp.]